MFYSEEDVIKQIPAQQGVTPFERHTCKAIAFGDNLALSATFATLVNGLDMVEQQIAEANENNNVSQDADALAIALMQSLAPLLQEV